MAGIITNSGSGILRKFSTAVAVSFATSMLVGCGVTPTDGPRAGTYNQAAAERVTGSNPDGTRQELPFILLDVDRKTVDVLEAQDQAAYFKGAFTDRRGAADIRIGLGDIIRVTIFEAGSGGLFVPSGGTMNGGNFVAIPDQEVDRTGSISVPYAAKNNDGGVIKVHNKRPIEVQAEVEQRLADRAIEPQVVVTIVNRSSNLYSVIGDVNTPGRYNVSQNGVRILDAIGSAGGPETSAYNTLVTLQRGTSTATARLSTLIKEPQNNIFVRPNDIISLKKEERYYNIFGSVENVDRVPFDSEKLTLADALAKAGGLDGERADPKSIILYRREDADTLKQMGASLDQFKWHTQVPAVYRLDLTQPSGYFLAQQMPLKDSDIVYVSNHPYTDVSKLLTIVRDILLIRLIDD